MAMSGSLKPEDKFSEQTKALLMIQVMGQTSVNFLNKKKLGKEMQEHLSAFEIDEADLMEFAEFFVDSSMNSKAYKTAVFGAIPMSDAGAATRLAEHIDEITRIIPSRFALEEEGRPLRAALLAAFRKLVKNADSILGELGL